MNTYQLLTEKGRAGLHPQNPVALSLRRPFTSGAAQIVITATAPGKEAITAKIPVTLDITPVRPVITPPKEFKLPNPELISFYENSKDIFSDNIYLPYTDIFCGFFLFAHYADTFESNPKLKLYIGVLPYFLPPENQEEIARAAKVEYAAGEDLFYRAPIREANKVAQLNTVLREIYSAILQKFGKEYVTDKLVAIENAIIKSIREEMAFDRIGYCSELKIKEICRSLDLVSDDGREIIDAPVLSALDRLMKRGAVRKVTSRIILSDTDVITLLETLPGDEYIAILNGIVNEKDASSRSPIIVNLPEKKKMSFIYYSENLANYAQYQLAADDTVS